MRSTAPSQAPAWTPDALAKDWDCHRKTVMALIHRGELPHFKIGPQYRVTDEAKREYESQK